MLYDVDDAKLYASHALAGPDAELARDWELFQAVESGEARFLYRFWNAPAPAVVLGRNGVAEKDVMIDACRRDNVPVVRRCSGGGTVVLGPGCFNYAIAVSLVSEPALTNVGTSFKAILGGIVTALDVPGLSIAGTDLALD